MVSTLRPAIILVVLFTLLTGLVLPLGITGIAGLVAPGRAGGSLVMRDGHAVGSALIGQSFTSAGYFQGRPSATTAPDPADPARTVPMPYDADNSAASNLGPTARALVDRVRGQVSNRAVPDGGFASDAFTSSGSGLDPDISPRNAAQQLARVAAARHVAPERLAALVAAHTRPALLELFGEPTVDVLALNLALDRMK